MKKLSILLILLSLILSFCDKPELEPGPEPNENWTSGDDWLDTRDEQSYATIQIGDQVWMADNLVYLPKLSHPSNESYTDPYYYVFDYEGTSVSEAQATDNYQTYGVLYNWPAAKEACPTGWHLPTDDEWKKLEKSLGMSQTVADSVYSRGTNEGGKLKEIGLSHWVGLNTGATNESGFTALPGGVYKGGHTPPYYFSEEGFHAFFWSSTDKTDEINKAWNRQLYCNSSKVIRSSTRYYCGISVRCVKDE
jgi:uncharacterized protein (TIGR02145 family)